MKALTLKSNHLHLYKESRINSHKAFKLDKVNKAGNNIDVIKVDKLLDECQKQIEGRRCDCFVFYNIEKRTQHVGIYIIETASQKDVTDAEEQIQEVAQLLDDHLERLCSNSNRKTFHFMPVVVTNKLNMIKGEKGTKQAKMPTISCHLCHKPKKILKHIKLGASLEPLAL